MKFAPSRVSATITLLYTSSDPENYGHTGNQGVYNMDVRRWRFVAQQACYEHLQHCRNCGTRHIDIDVDNEYDEGGYRFEFLCVYCGFMVVDVFNPAEHSDGIVAMVQAWNTGQPKDLTPYGLIQYPRSFV